MILNITPDHFERHHTMKEYIRVKSRIFENMRQGDRLLLNRRDPVSAGLADKASCDVFFINTEGPEQQGAFLEDGMLKLRIDGRETLLCRESDIHLLGRHNMETAWRRLFWQRPGELTPAPLLIHCAISKDCRTGLSLSEPGRALPIIMIQKPPIQMRR